VVSMFFPIRASLETSFFLRNLQDSLEKKRFPN
jgi:hypothetical protein